MPTTFEMNEEHPTVVLVFAAGEPPVTIAGADRVAAVPLAGVVLDPGP